MAPRFLIASSGSTGTPKWLRVPEAGFAHWIAGYDLHWQPLAGGISLLTLPPDQTGFGHTLAMAEWLRGRGVMMPGGSVAETLSRAADAGVDAALLTPLQGAEFVAAMENGAPRPTFGWLMMGGAATDAALLGRWRRLFPDIRIVLRFGSSEGGAGAALVDPPSDPEPGDCGPPLSHAEVAILELDGDRPLPPGQDGRVALRLPPGCRPDGYLGGAPALSPDGWALTGDLGRIEAATGHLVLTGRASQVLNLGGTKIAPERIEATVAAMPGVAQSAAFAATESDGRAALCLLVVPAAGARPVAAELTDRIRAALGLVAPVRLRWTTSLPAMPTGKLDRMALPAAFNAAGA